MKKPPNCVLVIFGASGDLTRRKLVPGLFNLYCRGFLPDSFALLGVSRSEYDDDSFRERLAKGIREFAQVDTSNAGKVEEMCQKICYVSLNTKNPEEYQKIQLQLEELDRRHHSEGNYLFYLSTPPSLFAPIARSLGALGLQRQKNGSWRRLIVEKPFGYDLQSALRLNEELLAVFEEDQIYRIDHYLGKETVQNMLVLRFGNGIFEPLWNRNYVDHVEITAAEKIGVGNRGGYYDQAGALRDMFQNHLLHVLSMVAMEPPAVFNPQSVRDEAAKVFESLRPLDSENIEQNVIRGQYTASTIAGTAVKGYREEPGVPAESRTETYIGVKAFVDNWRWSGVPFYVRTGKHLPTRVTEVVIHFKQMPHRIFGQVESQYDNNQLIMRIQPDEGILLKFNMKLPGGGFQMKTVNMDFHYSDLADVYVPEAYERLLLDCMLGDATLYARGDAVQASWAFVNPILEAWKSDHQVKVYGYPAGTWGPLESTRLFHHLKKDWRYPCRNLADDGVYCEL
jgi:glucose-6-phosphate 1-dehydrogenase